MQYKVFGVFVYFCTQWYYKTNKIIKEQKEMLIGVFCASAPEDRQFDIITHPIYVQGRALLCA